MKPALTAEEWRAKRIHRFSREGGSFDVDWSGRGLEMGVGWEESGDDAWRVFRPIGDQHALAALCLHGQPFGFTREHWREIDRLARAAFPDSDCERILYEVAERIEALLPPESE